MSMKGTAKAGQLLRVDRGSWEDYNVVGFFVVLQDFDTGAELEKYLRANPNQRKECCFCGHDFLGALISKGLLLEVEHGNLYLGSNNNHENTDFNRIR